MPYNHGHISAIQLREHELQGSSQNLTCGRLFGNCTQVNQSPTALQLDVRNAKCYLNFVATEWANLPPVRRST